MGDRANVPYWAVSGALAGFGLIDLITVGLPLPLLGVAMAAVGLWRPGARGVWALPVGLGGLPALVFLVHIAGGIRSMLNPSCSPSAGPGVGIPPGAGAVSCSYVPVSYFVMFAVFAGVAVVGLALRRPAGRARPRES